MELKRLDLTWSGQVDLTAATLRSTLSSLCCCSSPVLSPIQGHTQRQVSGIEGCPRPGHHFRHTPRCAGCDRDVDDKRCTRRHQTRHRSTWLPGNPSITRFVTRFVWLRRRCRTPIDSISARPFDVGTPTEFEVLAVKLPLQPTQTSSSFICTVLPVPCLRSFAVNSPIYSINF